MTFTDAIRRIFRHPAIIVLLVLFGVCFDEGVTASDLSRRVIFGVAALILGQMAVILLRRAK